MRDSQRFEQQPCFQLICKLLSRGDNFIELSDLQELVNMHLDNPLTSALIFRIAERHGWENIPKAWHDIYKDVHDRISLYLSEMVRVTAIAKDSGIPLILLENGALAHTIHPHPGCYSFGDFDLMIVSRDLPRIHTLLLREGYTLIEMKDGTISGEPNFEDGRAEYFISLPNDEELRLNLQTQLVAHQWFNSTEHQPNPQELMARSLPVSGCHARILCPEDFLFQLVIHNASHVYVRKPGIRLHLDMEWFLQNTEVDWELFLEMTRLYKVQAKAYFSLLIPTELFGTPIPANVLAQLRPAGWKEHLLARWLQQAGVFNLNEKKFGRIKFILFTVLLYDDFYGVLRGIFPDSAWMKERYQFRNDFWLPYFHLQRIFNLLFRRLAT